MTTAPLLATTPIAHPVALTTTTIFPNGTAVPIVTTHHSSLPIASIVGGSVGGIALALVAVIGWIWWGKCIERDKAKKRSKLLAVLEVRENTRKNASSTHIHSPTYFTPYTEYKQRNRSVKFASGSSSISTTPLTESLRDVEKDPIVEDVPPVPPIPRPQFQPQKRSPLSNTAQRGSIVSTPSIYSVQSGEEPQAPLPPSLLMAALGTMDPRKPPSAAYLAPGLALSPSDGPSRLSQVSGGSAEIQTDEHPEIPIGYAQ